MVMGGARQLSVVLTLQDRFTKQMQVARAQVDKFGATTAKTTKQIDQGFKQNEQSVSKFLLALRRNFLAVTAVIGTGIALAAMFISAARDHARSITVLDGALQGLGTSWDDQRVAIEKLLDVVGGSTGASENTMLGALTTLIRETGNLDVAMRLLEPTFGLAARAGIPVSDAATLIAEALKGEDGAVAKMAEFGLRLDESAGAGGRLNDILEFTDGWAQKNNDSISQMNAKWEEMKRIVGEELMPTLEPLLDLFIELAPAIEGTLKTATMVISALLLPFKALEAAIRSVRKLLGLNEETGAPMTEPGIGGGGGSGGNGASRTFPDNSGAPPSAIIGGQIPWVPQPPWSNVGEQPSGVIGQGMSVTIVSNGDLDADRRIIERMDSAYRSGWRANT